jgi:transcription elongation factor GreA
MSKISRMALNKIFEEIKNLEVQREDEKEVCASAKMQGDLSENNDYHDSKERLSFIDRRIAELRRISMESVVVAPPLRPEYVSFGATVTLADNSGNKSAYKIVSDYEAENKNNERIQTISETSVIGKAMMSKKVGETIKFTTLRGESKEYKVLSILGAEEDDTNEETLNKGIQL